MLCSGSNDLVHDLKKNKITKAQYETLAEFRYALRQFLHFSETAAHAAGVTPQQHQAMLAIKGFPGRDHITIGELAERLQIAITAPSDWPTGWWRKIMFGGCRAEKTAARCIWPLPGVVKFARGNFRRRIRNNCGAWDLVSPIF